MPSNPPINPRLLRSYDLRGVVGRDLTEADAHALGLAYAADLAPGSRIAVGYDGRLSSPALEAALVAGLVEAGVTVERVGLGPTGLLYFAVHDRALYGGIMVTGSHNPPDQNGFKLLRGTEPVFGDALGRLIETRGRARKGGTEARIDLADRYLERLARAGTGMPALRVGWDPGNGAAADLVARLVARLPGNHRIINGTVDGRFPAHHPDPSEPANLAPLQQLVRAERLDLGIAFDGDGDRIGVVDGTGAIVWPDQLLLLLAQDQLGRTPDAPVVFDVKSSAVLANGIAAAGGRPIMAPSGYVLIRAAMLRERAPLAGETSGHIFYADDWYGTDCALHVAVRLLAALARTPLADFCASLPRTVVTPDLRLPCPDADKARILDAVAESLGDAPVDRTDGLRVARPGGWWLLRASGTEPKLTARIEAMDERALARLADDLAARLRAAGLQVDALVR